MRIFNLEGFSRIREEPEVITKLLIHLENRITALKYYVPKEGETLDVTFLKLQAVIMNLPNNDEGLFLKALFHLASGKQDKAIESIERLRTPYNIALGYVLAAIEKHNIEFFDEVIQNFSKMSHTYNLLWFIKNNVILDMISLKIESTKRVLGTAFKVRFEIEPLSEELEILDVYLEKLGLIDKVITDAKIVITAVGYSLKENRAILKYVIKYKTKVYTINELVVLKSEEEKDIYVSFTISSEVVAGVPLTGLLFIENISGTPVGNIAVSIVPDKECFIYKRRKFIIKMLNSEESISRVFVIYTKELPLTLKIYVRYTVKGKAYSEELEYKIDLERVGLRDLIVFYKASMTPIFSLRGSDETTSLLGGLLSAIQSIISSMLAGESFVKTIDKEEYKIVNKTGKNIVVTTIVHRESPALDKAMEEFIADFEKTYQKELEKFSGAVDTFSDAKKIFKRVFSKYLRDATEF